MAATTPTIASGADLTVRKPTLFERLVATDPRTAPFVARLALGIVMFPHGAQKMLGWFGGPGIGGTYHAFVHRMGIPGPFAALAMLAEFIGSTLLVLGLFTRIAAFGIMVNMIVATLLVHVPNGFFMNWMGQKPGEGFEYHLLAIGLALVGILAGGGSASVDRELLRATVRKRLRGNSPV